MGLTHIKDHLPAQCSGGEQQRCAVARAIIHEPALLFADEPTGALNKKNTTEVLDLLTALNAAGQSILMVTHDRDEAFRLSDSIAVMRDGAIEAIGTKHAVFSDPKTRAGAVLTGCKNVSPLKKLDERHILAVNWGMELTLDRDAGDAKYVGIRMHDILPGEGENSFLCRISEEIENPFSYTLMLRLSGSPDAAPVGWETDKAAWNALRAGEVRIRLPKESLLLLKE